MNFTDEELYAIGNALRDYIANEDREYPNLDIATAQAALDKLEDWQRLFEGAVAAARRYAMPDTAPGTPIDFVVGDGWKRGTVLGRDASNSALLRVRDELGLVGAVHWVYTRLAP